MSSTQNKTAMRVAVVAGVALSVAGATGIANAAPSTDSSATVQGETGATSSTPSTAGLTAEPGAVAAAVNSDPVAVSRLSVATGSQAGGTAVTIFGTNLSTATESAPVEGSPVEEPGDGEPPVGEPVGATSVTWSVPTVTFSVAPATKGGTPTVATVASDDIEVLSSGAIRVKTPASTVVGKATVFVKNGTATSSATKAPAFTYTAAPPEASSAEGTVTSETGGKITIAGTYLGDKSTKVLVGGKAAKVSEGTSTKLVADAPVGLTGVQDVVVSTKGGTVDAGHVTYSAIPVVVSGWGTPKVSVEKGATFEVTGTNLDTVTGGTFTDKAGVALKVTVKQPTVAADKGKKLTVTIPAKAAEGEGSIVLKSRYASSASQAITVTKAGVPTITTKDAALTVAGGSLPLEGTNLHFVTAVKVGSTTLKTTDYTVNDEATKLTLTVPAQAKAAKLAVTVTTAGGSATYSLPVSATLTGAAYNAETKVVSLTGTGLGSLTGIKVADAKEVAVATTFKAAADGKTSTATAYKTSLAAGTYTVTATDASGAKFSQTFTVAGAAVATGTITSASYADGVLTVVGTGLASLTDVKVTGTSPVVAAKTVTLVANEAGTSATVTTDLTAGAYKVTAKNSAGAAVESGSFDVAAAAEVPPAIAGHDYDAAAKTIVLTGTNLEDIALWTVTVQGESGPEDLPADDVAFEVNGEGTSVTLTLATTLPVGEVVVTGFVNAGDEMAADSVTFTVA